MNATEYLVAGKLAEAIGAITEEVRAHPDQAQKRTFLFELLCFAGEYDRAEKHLQLLAEGGRNAEMGVMVYSAALHAERERREFFREKQYLNQPYSGRKRIAGSWNGVGFSSLCDADVRIGARLEVFVAGRYVWVPYEHIESLEMQPPRRLRDLLWAPIIVRTGEGFPIRDLGEVLMPVLSPLSCEHADDLVRLGRVSAWEVDESGVEILFGQKMLLRDGEEVPILELRNVQFAAAAAAAP